jgi:hypothetical protein
MTGDAEIAKEIADRLRSSPVYRQEVRRAKEEDIDDRIHAALMALGVSGDVANRVIVAIRRGEIPHLQVE